MFKVDLSPKARGELSEAWEWYEEQQSGLGLRFENEFFKKAYLIESNPLHYPSKGKYRETKIDDFPYLIVFKVDRHRELILIVSVFHTSRHPKRKHKG
ncbi:MAG TPA: type II toxin-antitoxin system RelE/ParE family toxin [Mucilaginibacter sp.]|nr:type II toxin-antitoxin system RelE/ParE family toxin [Mucilaginibacter sp.]